MLHSTKQECDERPRKQAMRSVGAQIYWRGQTKACHATENWFLQSGSLPAVRAGCLNLIALATLLFSSSSVSNTGSDRNTTHPSSSSSSVIGWRLTVPWASVLLPANSSFFFEVDWLTKSMWMNTCMQYWHKFVIAPWLAVRVTGPWFFSGLLSVSASCSLNFLLKYN